MTEPDRRRAEWTRASSHANLDIAGRAPSEERRMVWPTTGVHPGTLPNPLSGEPTGQAGLRSEKLVATPCISAPNPTLS